MGIMGMAVVASISIIAYLIGEAVKLLPVDTKWIPVVCGICGGALGVLGMYTMADFPASDLLSAAAVGISSGLAATGANEAIKIVKK